MMKKKKEYELLYFIIFEVLICSALLIMGIDGEVKGFWLAGVILLINEIKGLKEKNKKGQ